MLFWIFLSHNCFWKQAKFINLWLGKQISLEEPASLEGDVVALQWQVPYLRIVQVFAVVRFVVNASWLSCVSMMTTMTTTTTTITGNNSTAGLSRQLRLYDCHHNFHFHYWDFYCLSDFDEHYTTPTRERAPHRGGTLWPWFHWLYTSLFSFRQQRSFTPAFVDAKCGPPEKH